MKITSFKNLVLAMEEEGVKPLKLDEVCGTEFEVWKRGKNNKKQGVLNYED